MNHELFKSLQNDVINLHVYWKVYRQLFASNEKRIELLNESGSLVFHLVQHSFINKVTLSICRLTDPKETKTKNGSKQNHTFDQLIHVTAEINHELAEKLKPISKNIKKSVESLRKRRNLSIAHGDLLTKLKFEENPLPGISREMIENILDQIRSFMNIYDLYYFENTTFYQDEILPLGADGDFLTQQLKRAIAFRDLEKKDEINRELWRLGRYQEA
jgi:AbiU2